jgi:hypothetical protein
VCYSLCAAFCTSVLPATATYQQVTQSKCYPSKQAGKPARHTLTCVAHICCCVRRSHAATVPSSVPVTSSWPEAEHDSAHTPDSNASSLEGSGSVLHQGCLPSDTSHTCSSGSSKSKSGRVGSIQESVTTKSRWHAAKCTLLQGRKQRSLRLIGTAARHCWTSLTIERNCMPVSCCPKCIAALLASPRKPSPGAALPKMGR